MIFYINKLNTFLLNFIKIFFHQSIVDGLLWLCNCLRTRNGASYYIYIFGTVSQNFKPPVFEHTGCNNIKQNIFLKFIRTFCHIRNTFQDTRNLHKHEF